MYDVRRDRLSPNVLVVYEFLRDVIIVARFNVVGRNVVTDNAQGHTFGVIRATDCGGNC